MNTSFIWNSFIVSALCKCCPCDLHCACQMKFLSSAASIWIILASGMAMWVTAVALVSYLNNHWVDFIYIFPRHSCSQRMNPINFGNRLTFPIGWCFEVLLDWLDAFLMDCSRFWYKDKELWLVLWSPASSQHQVHICGLEWNVSTTVGKDSMSIKIIL